MNKENELLKLRHTAEHILMQAMENLGYKILKAMGPATDTGFYFDFELLNGEISKKDFPKIEKEMKKIINQNLLLVKKEVSKEQALKIFKGNPYKQEWVEEAEKRHEKLSLYATTNTKGQELFVDLCAGPHVKTTGEIKAFKLISIAGAYWRGNEKNKMLTRIYGTAFFTKKDLDNYLMLMEEAEKRDHKKLGRELGLFLFHETAPGEPYWLHKGLTIMQELLDFWRKEHKKRDYKETSTPIINKKSLWETSGHWEHYKNDMFLANMGIDEEYGIKPMNCPNAMIIFDSETRSYKDLPLRLSDADVLHRYERSGTLNGLLRVRSFRQDDSHNFIRENQIESEYKEILNIAELFYGVFGLDFSYRLGTRPEKFMGDKKAWDKAENTLKTILKTSGRKFSVLEKDGAFYGPKVDIIMKDCLNRKWQMGTIQLDFQIPKRFKLAYINERGKKETPVVVHRVIYGSLERFIGILIEHFAGVFPLWLSPVQVSIIPISKDINKYAQSIKMELANLDIRVEADLSDETMQNKIRKAQEQKTPYMIILGKREQSANKISVRFRTGRQKNMITLEEFTKHIKNLIMSKSLQI